MSTILILDLRGVFKTWLKIPNTTSKLPKIANLNKNNLPVKPSLPFLTYHVITLLRNYLSKTVTLAKVYAITPVFIGLKHQCGLVNCHSYYICHCFSIKLNDPVYFKSLNGKHWIFMYKRSFLEHLQLQLRHLNRLTMP